MSHSDEDADERRRDAKMFGAASAAGRHISRDHQEAQKVVCVLCFRNIDIDIDIDRKSLRNIDIDIDIDKGIIKISI